MGDLFQNASPLELIWCSTDLAGGLIALGLMGFNVWLLVLRRRLGVNGGTSMLIMGDIGFYLGFLVFFSFLFGAGWVAAMAPTRPDAASDAAAGQAAIYIPLLLVGANFAALGVMVWKLAVTVGLDLYNRRHTRRGDVDPLGPPTSEAEGERSSRVLSEVQALQSDMADIHAASAPPPGGPGEPPLQVTIVQDPHAPVPVIVETPVPVIFKEPDSEPKREGSE